MPIQRSVSIAKVVEVLNRALEADPEAIRALFNQRTPCNQQLADDPTIQVGDPGEFASCMGTSIGLLGLINGFFGVDEDTGYGAIAAHFVRWETDGRLTLERFEDVDFERIRSQQLSKEEK